LHLIAHGHGGCDRNLEDARAPARIQKHARKVEALDDAVHDSVRTFALSLNTKPAPATNDLVDDGFRKTMFYLVAQRLILKRRDSDCAYAVGQLILRHRLV